MDLAAGVVLGSRYQIGARLGRGGMGAVYAAEDVRLRRKVAVKVIRSDLAKDPSCAARFAREAHATAAVSSPRPGLLSPGGGTHRVARG